MHHFEFQLILNIVMYQIIIQNKMTEGVCLLFNHTNILFET